MTQDVMLLNSSEQDLNYKLKHHPPPYFKFIILFGIKINLLENIISYNK